ncbi:MAG TPA: YkgJ family cysteine cluster protein [Acidisphaera sp.]|nr:YkgJ family cysteine cluster protein [Acidisphaera sp.]
MIRNAGDPEDFVRELHEHAEGKLRAMRTPCAGCSACCYSKVVAVRPDEERPEDLAHLDMQPAADGTLRLRKRDDGACVHLGETGCTVYDHRPRGCRAYDCRGMALVGLIDSFDAGRRSPSWTFRPTTERGRLLQHAFYLAGLTSRARFKLYGHSPTAAEVFAAAALAAPMMLDTLEARLSPARRAEMRDLDPARMTPEDYHQAMLALMRTADLDAARPRQP